jgi:glutaredoxin
MDKIIKTGAALLAVVVFCAAVLVLFPGTGSGLALPGMQVAGSNDAGGNITVYFFYGEECPHCHNVMPFVKSLRQKYPDIDLLILETWHNETNQLVQNTLNRELKISRSGVPEVIVGDTALIGELEIPQKLEQVVADQIKKKR